MHDEGTDSKIKTFANIFISFIGAGILGLPYAFKEVGLPTQHSSIEFSETSISSEWYSGGGHYNECSWRCKVSHSVIVRTDNISLCYSIKAMFLLIDCKNRLSSKSTLHLGTKHNNTVSVLLPPPSSSHSPLSFISSNSLYLSISQSLRVLITRTLTMEMWVSIINLHLYTSPFSIDPLSLSQEW